MGREEADAAGRCGGRGDVALVAAVDLAAVEVGGGAAVDEVDVSGDVALLEELAAGLQAERVLPAEEAAAAEDAPIAETPGMICTGKGEPYSCRVSHT